MSGLSKPQTAVKMAGVYGTARSVYYSLRFTGRPTSLLVHSNVVTDVSRETEFDIDNRFVVGCGGFRETHPRVGNTLFSTAAGSTVSHVGTEAAHVGPASVLRIEGTFEMGDSYINSHGRIICADEITIGDGVAIAWNFEALDDSRHQMIIDGEKRPQTAPIEIRDDVWIGHDVSVHKGVTIHEGSVVASNSVVLSDVPPNTLVAGSPAEVVRENVDWVP